MEKNINIVKGIDGKCIVIINNVFFKGRQNIEWKDVEHYLKQYVGKSVEIMETNDIVYIGTDFADEYTGSMYTAKLKGAVAKAKANAVQGICELLEIATSKRFKENLAYKHKKNAQYGWYRYDSRFALPIFNEHGDIVRYNVFYAELLIRHASDDKLYLYDIINIKKETGTPLEQ